MMKFCFATICYFLTITVLFSQSLPQKLSNIPDGLKVTHSPSKVYASPNESDKRNRGKYLWKYATTVETISIELEIVEFGAYGWDGKRWIEQSYLAKPFSNKEFEAWYACPKGKLKIGEAYTDQNNWSASNSLGQKYNFHLWYFIGKDKNENLYKGVKKITKVQKVNQEVIRNS